MVTCDQLENAFKEYKDSLLITCADIEEIREEHIVFNQHLKNSLNGSDHQISILSAFDRFFKIIEQNI